MTARSLLLAGVVAAALLASACGSAEVPAPTVLDTEKIEGAIERSILEQRDQVADVSCPASVDQQKGLDFSCMATVPAGATRFVVTQTDGSGQVHYEAP